MRRHELDVFSLVAGLVFLAVAAGHLADEAGGFDFDGRWVVPVAMVAIGIAGLASLAGKDRARSTPVEVEQAEQTPEPTTPTQEPAGQTPEPAGATPDRANSDDG